MINKLVVIINSLKVPKIKKIVLYEMKFLLPNYSCLQNSWLGGYRPQIPILSVLFPQLDLLNPPPRTKIPGDATGTKLCVSAFVSYIFTMWKCKCAVQQSHFTLTISARTSQELWNRESICTDQLVHVAPRKVCTERSVPLLGINVLIMTIIKSPKKWQL